MFETINFSPLFGWIYYCGRRHCRKKQNIANEKTINLAGGCGAVIWIADETFEHFFPPGSFVGNEQINRLHQVIVSRRGNAIRARLTTTISGEGARSAVKSSLVKGLAIKIKTRTAINVSLGAYEIIIQLFWGRQTRSPRVQLHSQLLFRFSRLVESMDQVASCHRHC